MLHAFLNIVAYFALGIEAIIELLFKSTRGKEERAVTKAGSDITVLGFDFL